MNLLVKLQQKRELRKLLRQFISGYQLSSLYTSCSSYYVVINVSQFVLPVFNQNVIQLWCDPADCNVVEKLIYAWGSSELDGGVVFTLLESQSQLVDNGRLLRVAEFDVKRTFEYLADVFGILNITPDSFSDGGKYVVADAATQRIIELVKSGAGVIDVGAQSTRPGAVVLDAAHELEILRIFLPTLIQLKSKYKFRLSIDTYHAETVTWLCDLDVDIINDVSGNLPLWLVKRCIVSGKRYVAMHSLVVPTRRDVVIDQNTDPLLVVQDFIERKLESLLSLGVSEDALIFDLGIGYGKSMLQSWDMLRRLDLLCKLPVEIMLAHSRKSFLRQVYQTNVASDLDLESGLVAARWANRVDYLRLHDLTQLSRVYPTLHELRYFASDTK